MALTDEQLIEALKDAQQARCSYGTRDGDGQLCDCKYATPLRPWSLEATGCPELRAAIWALQDHKPPAKPE